MCSYFSLIKNIFVYKCFLPLNISINYSNLSQLFNQLNNTTENHTNKDPANAVKCRYYDIEEIQTLKIPNKSKFLSIFHINTCSLSKNFDYLEYLLKSTNMNFDKILANYLKKRKQFSYWMISMLTFQNMSSTLQLMNF